MSLSRLCIALFLFLASAAFAEETLAPIEVKIDVVVPLRDGVELKATVHRPQRQAQPLPCLLTMTPYNAQDLHDVGAYFAARGYVFATVDVRGRGNSGGTFTPFAQEVDDGYDVVEWLARQPWCNGRVGMWGVSYLGYAQWAAASRAPPHLAAMAPSASPMPGLDFPMRNNVWRPYVVRWLMLVAERTAQVRLFSDHAYWNPRLAEAFAAHAPYASLDTLFGSANATFQEWIAHPLLDAYWRGFRPSDAQYARIDLPVLTITGQYDADQPGALTAYREHLANATPPARAKHWLVIGPWDHAGVAEPQAKVRGVDVGPAGVIDMNALHRAWYDFTLKDGPKPELLKAPVAYYAGGLEQWKYAESLAAIGDKPQAWYLSSANGRASDIYASGDLVGERAKRSGADSYVYDPLDVSDAALDPLNTPDRELVDQRRVALRGGKQLVYHTAAFDADTEIAGFFRLSAWIAIDQPDTDIEAAVYAIAPDGGSILLSFDRVRARHRGGLHQATLATPGKVERYDFERFAFAARVVPKGARLRLVVGPVNSPHVQKNYNSGGEVSRETAKDARKVRVTVYHDARRASALYVPVGAMR